MTPYEITLRKKLNQAIELGDTLLALSKTTGYDSCGEASILQALIQKITINHQQFDSQLAQYQKLSEKRRRLANEANDSIKEQTNRLWEDAGYQFKGGTVANDLLKILCQKIQRFPLPPFPVTKRSPLLCKTVRLYEDSYSLLGQYFSWLIDLLQVLNFTPIRPPYCLKELGHQASQYNLLTEQIMQEAELLKNYQLMKSQLYKQLNQCMRTAKGRLLLYKRESQRNTHQPLDRNSLAGTIR